jgi:threonine/homoserine/homoserine lactone efflux protein
MDKKNRGLIFTIFGMLFTSLGMFLLYLEKPSWMYVSSSILGVLLALFGVIKILKDNRQGSK